MLGYGQHLNPTPMLLYLDGALIAIACDYFYPYDRPTLQKNPAVLTNPRGDDRPIHTAKYPVADWSSYAAPWDSVDNVFETVHSIV